MRENLNVKGIITLLVICIIVSIATSVFAQEQNYSVGMALTSSSKLKEGDIVTVKVNLTAINAGNGIDTITAELNYDENVFEPLTSADITAGTNWTPSYANATKMLTMLKSSKVTAAENVLTIKLKVKSAINTDTTTITLKDVIASGGLTTAGGTGDISVNNASVTISREKVQPTPTPTTNTTNKTNTTVKDNTVTKTPTLPKTGIEQYGIMAILVIAIVAIFSYVVYKKIAKDVK